MALLSLPMFEKVFWPPWVVARVCKQFHLPSSFVQRETQLNDAWCTVTTLLPHVGRGHAAIVSCTRGRLKSLRVIKNLTQVRRLALIT